jgi:hypothetical protein
MTNDAITRKGLPLGKKAVRYVDGLMMRNMTTDLDIILWKEKEGAASSAFVPRDEVWIDWRYKKEASFLIDVMRAESAPRFAGKPYAEVRAFMKETLCAKEPAPQFVVRSGKRGKLAIRYVRGDIIRKHFDPAFIFGGHDLVYDYVPKNEVWIDVLQDPREVRFTLAHELRERALMAKGMGYDDAHAKAIAIEAEPRAKLFTVDMDGPIPMQPFRQRAAYCGPASLKMVLGYLGREFSESRLARMCGTTKKVGTPHLGLIKGAKAAGASAFEKKDGTFDELRYFVHTERLPAIIGWVSPEDPSKVTVDDEHYSVVFKVTDTHIFIMDPEIEWGRRQVRIKDFEKWWWDTEEGTGAQVARWYMILNLEGKTFDFPEGTNH